MTTMPPVESWQRPPAENASAEKPKSALSSAFDDVGHDINNAVDATRRFAWSLIPSEDPSVPRPESAAGTKSAADAAAVAKAKSLQQSVASADTQYLSPELSEISDLSTAYTAALAGQQSLPTGLGHGSITADTSALNTQVAADNAQQLAGDQAQANAMTGEQTAAKRLAADLPYTDPLTAVLTGTKDIIEYGGLAPTATINASEWPAQMKSIYSYIESGVSTQGGESGLGSVGGSGADTLPTPGAASTPASNAAIPASGNASQSGS